MIYIDFKSYFRHRTKLPKSFPIGMILFTGAQGAGKSLCQMKYIYNMQKKWQARVFSATDYKYFDEKIDEDAIAKKILTKRQSTPTIFALDEIQILLDPSNTDKSTKSQIRKAIQQQRKRNTSIVGTCQQLLDLDMIYRRQIEWLVECSHIGSTQIENWYEGSTLKFDSVENKYVGKLGFSLVWKRNDEMYNLYDTYEVVGDTDTFDSVVKTNSLLGGSTP